MTSHLDEIRRKLSCINAQMFFDGDSFQAATAIVLLLSEIDKRDAEIQEALQVSESCSTLADLAAACIEGAYWEVECKKRDTLVRAAFDDIDDDPEGARLILKTHLDALEEG